MSKCDTSCSFQLRCGRIEQYLSDDRGRETIVGDNLRSDPLQSRALQPDKMRWDLLFPPVLLFRLADGDVGAKLMTRLRPHPTTGPPPASAALRLQQSERPITHSFTHLPAHL